MTIQVEPPVQVAAGVRVDTTGPLDPAFEPLDIAVDRCKGCGLCVDVCPKHVLELDVAIVNALGYHPVRLTDAAGLHELRAVRPDLPGRRVHRLRPPEGSLTWPPSDRRRRRRTSTGCRSGRS